MFNIKMITQQAVLLFSRRSVTFWFWMVYLLKALSDVMEVLCQWRTNSNVEMSRSSGERTREEENKCFYVIW